MCDTLDRTVLVGVESGIMRLECCPAAPLAVLATADCRVIIWNISDWEHTATVQEFTGHMRAVHCAEMLDDGTVITGGADSIVAVYDTGTVERRTFFELGSSALSVAVSAAGGGGGVVVVVVV